MGIFSNWIGSFIGNRYTRGYYLNYMGRPTTEWVSINGNEINLFNTIPQLRLVILRRASMLANAKYVEYRNGEPVEDSEHVKFLNKPNPLQSRDEFFTQREVQMCLFGNAFSYSMKGSALQEVPSVMWNLPAGELEVHRTGKLFRQTEKDDIVSKVTIFGGTKEEDRFTYSELWHSNMAVVDDPVLGVSPLLALQKPLSNIDAAYSYRNVIMKEKGAIGILSNEFKEGSGGMPLTATERQRIEKAYNNNYGLEKNKSKVIMSEASLKWQPMSYPTKDMMLFEEIDDNFTTIIDEYGLNRNIFSFDKGSTFSNVFEGLKMAYQDTIIPIANSRAREYSEYVGMDVQRGDYIKADFSHVAVMAKDEDRHADTLKKKAETADKLISSGVMSVQEVRDSGLFDDLLSGLRSSI